MAPASSDSTEERPLLEVGYVARPHGLLGEVVVSLVTNRTERLDPGSQLVCRPVAPTGRPVAAGRPVTGGPAALSERALTVRSSRPANGRHLVVFEGVHTREAADALRGALLLAAPIDDPDALFVHRLIGCELVEVDGTRRGEVVAVQANPASDLLVLEGGSLVPLRFVVDREEGRIVVDAPPGLFE